MTDETPTGGMTKQTLNVYLAETRLARIATTNPNTLQPHVVPVWYGWDGKSLWISSFRSTRKISELRKNPKCSIVIDSGDGTKNEGVVMEGEAELITEPVDFVRAQTTWVYTRYLGSEGVLAPDPQSWIADPENLLIKLTPAKIISWHE